MPDKSDGFNLTTIYIARNPELTTSMPDKSDGFNLTTIYIARNPELTTSMPDMTNLRHKLYV